MIVKYILLIISNLISLFKFKKTDAKVIENKKRKREQQQMDLHKKVIADTHKTNDLEEIRKLLGD